MGIPSNYIPFVTEPVLRSDGSTRPRLSFKGKHNKTKTILLWAIREHPGSTSKDLFKLVASGRSFSCLRSTLSRLYKYGYIGQNDSYDTWQYHILSKGERFLWAAELLAPIHEWVYTAVHTSETLN